MEVNTLVNAVKANGLHEILHQSLESGHCPSPVAGVCVEAQHGVGIKIRHRMF
jgi:hypothetical protein